MTFRLHCYTHGALLMAALQGSAALAAPPSLADREMMQAAVVVVTFDVLAQRCQNHGGFKDGDARRVAQWQREQRVDLIRQRLAALERSPADRAQLGQGRAQAEQQLASIQGAQACSAAVAATRQPAAQFATTSPGLLAALEGSKGKPVPPAPSGQAGPAAGTGAAPSSAAASAAQVQAFGFDTRMQMGVGGALWPTPYPVVLLRDGSALKDIVGLSYPGGLEAHRLAEPKAWTQWRRSGGRLQLLTADKGWKDMSYNVAYEKLPGDFRLDGRYQSLSGSGTVAVGGGASVAAWRLYEFSGDGRVTRSGGAGGSTEAGGTSTVTASRASVLRGQYRIDGLTLQIQYDDGSAERRLIVADPKDPKTALWLDGVGYSRRRN